MFSFFRSLTASGVLAPIAFFGTAVAASMARPGYDQVEQLMSELGESGAAMAVLWNVGGFGLTGALIVAFAVAVRRAAGSWLPGSGALVLGAGLVLLAVSPCDAGCPVPPTTFTGVMHFPVLTLVAYAGLVLTPLLIGLWVRTRPDLAGIANPSLVVAGVVLGLIVASFAGSAAVGDRMAGFGLLQRMFVGLSLASIGAIAVALRRAEQRAGGSLASH